MESTDVAFRREAAAHKVNGETKVEEGVSCRRNCRLCGEILESTSQFRHRAGALIEEVVKYVEEGGACKRRVSKEEFAQTWEAIYTVVAFNKNRRDKKRAVLKR
jgi:hypothetical protein